MQIQNPVYMEGWTDLAREVQRELHKSITRHHGATSAQDVFAVLNDWIAFAHRLNLIDTEYREYLASQPEQKPEFEERLMYLAVDNTKE